MWQELTLVHRETGSRAKPLCGDGHLWRTCLRELLFLEPGSHAPEGKKGAQAYRLLVEICSGLHSPLFGETEVFGQFRAFRDSKTWDPRWLSLFDAVELDVRKLRREHLTDLGSQSYGSLARRHLPPDKPVVIVGAGRLTKDLLPWLEGFRITVTARNPKKASRELNQPVVSLQELIARPPASWLIAAPISNQDLQTLWEVSPAGTVLDFRGEEEIGPSEHVEKYLSLRALFLELERAKAHHEKIRGHALAYAAELAERREQAVVHRPYGWEDAFA